MSEKVRAVKGRGQRRLDGQRSAYCRAGKRGPLGRTRGDESKNAVIYLCFSAIFSRLIAEGNFPPLYVTGAAVFLLL